MKTKAEIVQNLLDAHQITAEHAVILLTPDTKEVQYIYIKEHVPFVEWPRPYLHIPYWESLPGTYCKVESTLTHN